jgi:hypothetical protein
MMSITMKKTILGGLIAGALGLASTGAMADAVFTVNPLVAPNVTALNTFLAAMDQPQIGAFQADKIAGTYSEIFTATSASTFSSSIVFVAGNFVDGSTALSASQTGLGEAYGMYGLYQASGTYSVSGGSTTFNTTPGTGSLELYLDSNTSPTFGTPSSGLSPYTVTSTGTSTEIASGIPEIGSGTLYAPNSGNCALTDCGSFGTSTTFALTNPLGPEFFSTFGYDLSLQSGVLPNFPITADTAINGEIGVTFGNAVPEPSNIALLGLGLLALGLTLRGRKNV